MAVKDFVLGQSVELTSGAAVNEIWWVQAGDGSMDAPLMPMIFLVGRER